MATKKKYEPERKAVVMDGIKRHLGEHGQKNYNLLFEKFPDVERGTIWTWLREVRNEPASMREIAQAQAQLQERIQNETSAHIPSPLKSENLSPALVAKAGAPIVRQIDFGAEIPKLYHDAEMLRAFSVKEVIEAAENGDPDAQKIVEKIKNPMQFEKSIRSRASVIETALKITREIWDMRRVHEMYECVVDEIGKADLETQKRILTRLAALNGRLGMTTAMRL